MYFWGKYMFIIHVFYRIEKHKPSKIPESTGCMYFVLHFSTNETIMELYTCIMYL